MRRWRLEDAPELRSTRGQPHERRTCPLQSQVREGSYLTIMCMSDTDLNEGMGILHPVNKVLYIY